MTNNIPNWLMSPKNYSPSKDNDNFIFESTQWNSLSSSLKSFRISDTFILIFDTTLKYIILLGNLSLNMLTALKLRSVGKNNHKQKSPSAIAETTFIKSTEMAEDMLNTMTCRGFTGMIAGKVEEIVVRELNLINTDIQ